MAPKDTIPIPIPPETDKRESRPVKRVEASSATGRFSRPEDIPPPTPLREVPFREPWNSPFRSPKKLLHYAHSQDWSLNRINRHLETKHSSLWREKEQRKYYLHMVGPPGTYNIDYFFDTRDRIYFLAININTRKAYGWHDPLAFAEPNYEINFNDGSKTTERAIEHINRLVAETGNVKCIIHDLEPAFRAGEFLKELKDLHIISRTYNTYITEDRKERKRHSIVSMIDRLSRTLRDMWYNANGGHYHPITPRALEWLLKVYNNSPHSTLSKIFRRDVCPNQVTPQMEYYLCRYLIRQNIINYSPVNEGEQYKLRWFKDSPFEKRRHPWHELTYKALGNEHGTVLLKNPKDISTPLKVSRWMIKRRH